MLGVRPMQDDAGARHLQMWPSATVPTADENAHAQPRGKAGERVVTFQDPEGMGTVRKAFGGRVAHCQHLCHTLTPAPRPAFPRSPPTPQRRFALLCPEL